MGFLFNKSRSDEFHNFFSQPESFEKGMNQYQIDDNEFVKVQKGFSFAKNNKGGLPLAWNQDKGTVMVDQTDSHSLIIGPSFDYAVVEKAKSVAAVSYDGEWKDLGTWNTLTEVMDTEPIGDVVMDGCCRNTHAINELDIPVVVMGAKDMVVAASPDGILVADKVQSSYIKKYVEDRDMRPMFEERSWGEYKVLDFAINEDGTKSLTKRKKIKAGRCIEYQSHRERSEVITVISGKCIITINDRSHEAYAGDTYAVAEGVKHGLEAVTDTEIIEVQVGRELIADGTEQEEREKFC